MSYTAVRLLLRSADGSMPSLCTRQCQTHSRQSMPRARTKSFFTQSSIHHSSIANSASRKFTIPSRTVSTLSYRKNASFVTSNSSHSLRPSHNGASSVYNVASVSRCPYYSAPSVLPLPTHTITRNHSGHSHSHGHGHSHDNSLLLSTDKHDAGVRITRIGLVSNLGMAIAKFVGGYMFASHAMIADAWHSLTDLASDFLTLGTVAWSLKSPTSAYPSGYGKIESLGSLGVSGMLLTGGLFMCWGSFAALLQHIGLDPSSVLGALLAHGHEHAHSHSHSHLGAGGPSIHAAWLAAGTVVIKEWLYQSTMAIAKKKKSSVLASNAVHHRVDGLTGVVTLAVVVASNFLSHAQWLDPVGGLLISFMVIKAGFENTVSAVLELADRGMPPDVLEPIREQAEKTLEQIRPTLLAESESAHEMVLRDVNGLKSGQNLLLELAVAVPQAWTLATTQQIETRLRDDLGHHIRGTRRVRIRFVPVEQPVSPMFSDFVAPAHEHDHEHEHDHDHDHSHQHRHQQEARNEASDHPIHQHASYHKK